MRREVAVWERVRHPRILSFLGISNDFGPFPSLISPWMENGMSSFSILCIWTRGSHLTLGNVMSFLRNHPNANRKRMLLGIARGLAYLHRA